MFKLNLNTSIKFNLIVAVFISIWLVVFLIIIAPFDASDLDFKRRLILMPPYGIISFVSYALLIPIQNAVFKKWKWNIIYEILFIIIFNNLVLLGVYFYYKSDFINGDYSFTNFTLNVYYPIFLILLTILIVARWLVNKNEQNNNIEKISITGDNKLDVLNIYFKDLICISSADNYVEVNYLNDNKLEKKLLRTTLKKIESNINGLLKVHRSHLINPLHFKAFKNQNNILLTQTELPISKNYKESILKLNNSSLK